jgi:chromosome segregation ATPase
MSRYATLDPTLTSSASDKRKAAALIAPSTAKKKRISKKLLIQVRTLSLLNIKQSVKDLHIQMQNHKELLTKLQPALESKKARKAALEAELRTLTTEIEADEKRMAELPESMEKI